MDEVKTGTRSGYYDLCDDSDDDEWYYSSISRFEQLQMFNFETPAYHLDLSEDSQICFSGKTRSDQQEIQEFVLPEKFSNSSFESHDLKLKTGGFSSKPIYQMKCLRGLRKLVLSEEGSNGASVYELGCESSDFIKKVSDIKCNVERPQLAVCGNKIALGSSSHNIHLANADSSQVVILPQNPESSAEDILGLSFVDNHSIAYCESQLGRIILFDCRSHLSKIYASYSANQCLADMSLAKVWYSFSVQHNSNYFGLVSSQGNIFIYDSRGSSKFPVIETKLAIDISDDCHLQLMFSPHDDSFSVAGNSTVNVFRIEADRIKTVFSYDGHSRLQSKKNVLIYNHIWSPAQKNLLFSSAMDGSFHCWKFIENKCL